MIGKILHILFGVMFITVGAGIIKNGGGYMYGFPVTPATGALLCCIGIVEFFLVWKKTNKRNKEEYFNKEYR